MIILAVIFALLVSALYGFIMYQTLQADEVKSIDRLKTIFATLHLQLDELLRIKSIVHDIMRDEKTLWKEFDAAETMLREALSHYDIDELAHADAEMGRCEFDLKERVAAYDQLRHKPEVMALMKEVESLDQRLSMHVDEYNASVQHYNQRCRNFPYMMVRKLAGFKPRQRFMHEAATVMDPNLSAVVID